MAIACPACNKAGQTDAACQRCGCDLTRLHGIVAAAATRLAGAAAALEHRDWPGALAEAERSWRLLHTAESAQLAWVAAAACGDTARALRWRERAAP
jgi:hypothetical protein